MVMDEGHQGKVFLDVRVHGHLLALSVHVHRVLGLFLLVTLDPLFLHGLKIQELGEAFIHPAADLPHHSVQEVLQDVFQEDGIPLQEEVVNPAQCPVLQEDLPPPLGLHLKLQTFLLPSSPVHLQVLQILN